MYYTVEKVKALAALTRLQLGEEEIRSLVQELEAMRALADRLGEGDAEIEDRFLGALTPDCLRADLPCRGEDGAIDRIAPASVGNCIVVPRAVEDGHE